MKKIFTLFVTLCIAAVSWAKAITFYGYETNNYVPFSASYADEAGTKSQFIYLLDDPNIAMLVGKSIEGITFYATSTLTFGNNPPMIEIRMAEVQDSELSNFVSTDFTTVYSGRVETGSEDMYCEFTMPFTYTGDGNLLVEVEVTGAGGYQSVSFYVASQTSGAYYKNGSGTSGRVNYVPKAAFRYEGALSNFYITGNAELVGEEIAWSPTAVPSGDDSFTFPQYPAGEYAMKITTDGTWETAKGYYDLTTVSDGLAPDNDGNITFTLTEPSDITVTYTGIIFTVEGAFSTTGTGTGQTDATYYMKNNWGGGDWTWKEMTAADNGLYVLENVEFGGVGVNYNTSAADDGATWVALDAFLGDDIAAGDTVTFTLDPNAGTITATKVAQGSSEDPDKNYYIVGVYPLLNTSWEITSQEGLLTHQEASNYTYTIESLGLVAGQEYTYKIIANNSWDVDTYPRDDSNYSFTVDQTALYTVTFNFTRGSECTASPTKIGDLEITTYTIMGDSALVGVDWVAGNTTNDMTGTGDGWQLTKKGVYLPAGTYHYEVAGNHDPRQYMYPIEWHEYTIEQDGTYDLTFTLTNPTTAPNLSLTATKGNYYLNGSDEHLGAWNWANSLPMNGDSIELTLPANAYEFKVYPQNTSGDNEMGYSLVNFDCSSEGVTTSTGTYNANNIRVVLEQEGTLRVKVVEGQICVNGVFGSNVVINSYSLLGDSVLFGRSWDLSSRLHDMTKQQDDTYVYVLDSVFLNKDQQYYFKVVANHSWAVAQYPTVDDNDSVSVPQDGIYSITFTLDLSTAPTPSLTATVQSKGSGSHAEQLADGYYLVGTHNNWAPTSADLFTVNPEVDEEYILNTTLTLGNDLKVVQVIGNENSRWFPDGDNIVVDAAHAGDVTIYFRPTYNAEWSDVGGYMYIVANASDPQDEIYSLLGTSALFGNDWDYSDTLTELTLQGESMYTYTIDSVALQTGVDYEYKVVTNHTVNVREWPSIEGGDNYHLTVEESGVYQVLFTFNPNTGCSHATNYLHAIVDDACTVASGTCGAEGDNLTWQLGCDSILTISGIGQMASYTSFEPGWQNYSSRIKNVIINNGVTSVGRAFYGDYDSVISVNINGDVSSIRSNAFLGCNNLQSITCYALTPPSMGSNVFDETILSTCLLYVPAQSVALYKAASEWSVFGNIQAIEGTEEIVSYYIIGNTEHFGEWVLDKAFPMNGDSVQLTLPAGVYQFRILPQNTGWNNDLGYSALDASCSSPEVTGNTETNDIIYNISQETIVTIKVVEGMICVTGNSGESTPVLEEGTATMTAGTNGSVCKVNEKDGIKVGTSNKGGDMRITVPAGAKHLYLYAAAWQNVTELSINITGAEATPSSITLQQDAGINGNSPFTLSNDESNYKFNIALNNISEETTLTLASDATKRFVVWNATYSTSAEGEDNPQGDTIPATNKPTESATPPTYERTNVRAIYSPTYEADCEFGEWGSGTVYTQDEFGKKYQTTDLGYFGMEFNSLNCTNMEYLHMDIWIAENASIRVVPIWGGAEQGVTKNLIAGQWNSIDIPLSEFDAITDWSNIIQIKIDNAPNLTFWIGNAYFYTTQTIAEDHSAPTDVSATITSVSCFSVELQLNAVDESGSITYAIFNGEEEIAATTGKSGTMISKLVHGLNSNTTYNFAIVASDESGNQAEAITVVATTLETPASANRPTISSDSVLSLYSDAYPLAPAPVNTYNAGWWEPPYMTAGKLAENDSALFYHSATTGVIGWQFDPINATNYPYFNIAIYPMKSGTITLGPIYGGDNLETTEYLTEGHILIGGQWNYISLDLSDKDLSSIWQLTMRDYYNLGGFFVDNVYFSKSQTGSDCIVASGTCGADLGNKNIVWILTCDSVLTIAGNGAMEDYTLMNLPWWAYRDGIKNVYISDGVTIIGKSAFARLNSLSMITIPNSVTDIRERAFEQCSSLISIVIPDGVTSIENHVFSGCDNLTNIIIPSSVTNIGDDAFEQCSSMTSIEIPDGVTNIGNYAFFYCSGLSSITIPNGVQSIGIQVFAGCSSLTNVTIHDNVTSIGEAAFTHCSGLTNITIPESVTSIGYAAFAGCSSLTNVNIPSRVTSIEGSVFSGCSSLTNVNIHSSVTSIGGSAFYGCSSLTNVTIPNSVTSIGKTAFEYCSGLTRLEIPSSVTSIGKAAFTRCKNLASIEVDSENTKYDSRDNCNAIIETSTNGLIAGCQNTIIPNDIISIDSCAFQGCESLISIDIPHNVIILGDAAFGECTGLTSIVIPNSVVSMGKSVFHACTNINSIELSNNITKIEEHTFDGCSNLLSVSIPDGITIIGKEAFLFNSKLANVSIPSSVTNIEQMAFEFCPNLTSITCYSETPPTLSYNVFDETPITSCMLYVPAESVEIYQTAEGWKDFMNIQAIGSACLFASGTCGAQGDNVTWQLTCDSILTISGTGAMASYTTNSNGQAPWAEYGLQIRDIIIEEGVTSLSAYGFYNAGSYTNGAYDNVRTLTIPSTVAKVVNHNFYKCPVETVTINSDSIIGKGSYSSGSSLQGIFGAQVRQYIIGDSVRSIANNAFYNQSADSLTTITLPEGLQSIGTWSFGYLEQMTSIVIPNTVLTIGSDAFAGCNNLRSVHLGASLTSIGAQAFWKDTMITRVTCEALTPPTLGVQAFDVFDTLFVRCESRQLYKEATNWKNFRKFKCLDGGDELDEWAFPLGKNWTFVMLPTAFGMNAEDIAADDSIAWATYNGEKRALGNPGWEIFDAAAVHSASHALLVRAKADTATLRINVPVRAQSMDTVYVPLSLHPATHAENANWCFVGNPYPYGYLLSGLAAQGITSPIFIYNGTGYDFYTPGIDDFIIPAFGAFFIQLPEDTTDAPTIMFTSTYIMM